MERNPIAIEDFDIRPYAFFEMDWLLLSCGDFATRQFNAMTISWGAMGVMWNRPYAQVVVRPVRYTFEFMERYDSFTLCAFPQSYHEVLSMLGTRSGRDGDKIGESGLTPTAATQVASPGYAEAELIIECKKVYWQDLDPEHFLKPDIARNYPRKDYHRMYFGEIVAVQGTSRYIPRRNP